jgi:hypothetical protein
MTMLVGDSYRREQERLKKDPHIIKMANELKAGLDKRAIIARFTHGWSEAGGSHGTPRHEFMGQATNEYVRLCSLAGDTPRHETIGGPARAILTLALDES